MRVKDVRARHIKACIENGSYNGKSTTANIKSRIKSMFNLMLDYALEYELVDKNYARTFNLSDNVVNQIEENRKEHVPFTNEELNILWDNSSVPLVNMILVQCYMGWRPQEICNIKLSDVYLEKKCIIGGMKTNAGKNRIVPIPDLIFGIANIMYSLATSLHSEYLFLDSNMQHMTYDKYRHRFKSLLYDIGIKSEHRLHDCRKMFITLAKDCGMDEYALKKIVGHAVTDITEAIYTDRSYEWLYKEMNKVQKNIMSVEKAKE